MYIRRVEKKNGHSGKTYSYYRLVHGYKIGDKVRQQTLLNLGKLEELPVSQHKMLADRIEMLLTGTTTLFSPENKTVDKLAQRFVAEIRSKGLFPGNKRKTTVGTAQTEQYEEINIESIESEECREIGGEWLCQQAFERLGLPALLQKTGMDQTQVHMTQMLLTAKLIHPSSELETERWLKENSGAIELYDEEDFSTTRYRLYQSATMLYKEKDLIEKELYSICTGLFTQRSKIVIYDLTNMYFEGQMKSSVKAKFGRSKEKRSDCRLIGLSMAIDSNGFVRHSQLYTGNISEPSTLGAMLDNVNKQLSCQEEEKPVVVMDAGIATEENLDKIKQEGYDYVCVSRIQPKEFDKLSDQATYLQDNRGNKIEVQKVSVEGKNDTFLHIKSDRKVEKEKSMDERATSRFEDKLIYLKQGLSLPRRTKKIIPVHEAIGRMKDQFSKVAKLYKIEYKEDTQKGIVTDITWTRQQEKEKPKGEYFLRYSQENLTEKEIWNVYNLSREVESVFRCLKSDLNIRPIHHQKDAYIEPHIWLGIIAYQVVNYIRQILKENNINYSWDTIVGKMKTQKCSLISMDAKTAKRIFVKLCSRPNDDVQQIYDSLKFKNRPYVRKTKVVTQL
jgi:hypothetical protein